MYKLIFLTLTLVLVLVLAACGDDGVSPTDLIPAGASAWIGDEIAIRDLVEFQDFFGTVSKDSDITATGVDNLDRLGDSFSAAVERHRYVTFSVGTLSMERGVEMTWLQDFRLSDWRISFSCSSSTASNNPPDSLAVDLGVDKVKYDVLPGIGTTRLEGSVSVSGTITDVRTGVSSTRNVDDYEAAFSQVMHILGWGDNKGTATSVEDIPSSYIGGDWCTADVVSWSGWQNASPVVFAKIP